VNVWPRLQILPAALPALTSLRASCSRDADMSGLTRLRRLEVRVEGIVEDECCAAVEGLSGLTALEDLRLECQFWAVAQPSDLAPLTALTRLAMTALPPELGSHPVAARLRRLELQAFDELDRAPEGTAAAALAALARGATLLERLVIRVDDDYCWDGHDVQLMRDHPTEIELGAALDAGVAWPSLTHLQVTAWAALLLAGCTFPRLSRLSAYIVEGDEEDIPLAQLATPVAALAAKARDHAALRVIEGADGVFHAAGALAATGLSHLSWRRPSRAGAAAAPPGDWARLAASLESLELVGPLPAFGYAGPLAALTRLTRLHINAEEQPCRPQGAGVAREGGARPRGLPRGALVRTARALARLPRLAHLRLTFVPLNVWPRRRDLTSGWDSPLVAAALARCPALRVLEVDRRNDPLWRHKLGPAPGIPGRVPQPSPEWAAFAGALRAGGCGAALRPAPAALTETNLFSKEFDVEC
jgi:hypothetical protein